LFPWWNANGTSAVKRVVNASWATAVEAVAARIAIKVFIFRSSFRTLSKMQAFSHGAI
jgi:hypothetical protein